MLMTYDKWLLWARPTSSCMTQRKTHILDLMFMDHAAKGSGEPEVRDAAK